MKDRVLTWNEKKDVRNQVLLRNGSCGTSGYLLEFESNFRAHRKRKKRETEAPWDLKKGIKKEEPKLVQVLSSPSFCQTTEAVSL